MMCPSKPTSAAPGPLPQRRHSAALCVFCFALLVSSPEARIYSRTSFPVTGNGASDSNLVLQNNALALSVDRYQTLKIYGDSIVATNRTISSYFPDVFASGDSTFAFFWADPLGVNRKEYQIQGNQAAPLGLPQKIGECNAADRDYYYLHSDKGENGYLVAYATNSRVRLINGSTSLDIDPTASTIPLSLCAGQQDTYYLTYIADAWLKLKLTKIYSRGNSIQVITTVTVDSCDVTVALMNPSVAADSNGTVLVTWSAGGISTTKNLHYRVFDNSLTPLNGATFAAANIARRSFFDYYDNAPAVAYGSGRYAIASWDSAGVSLHLIAVNGTTVSAQATRIITRPLIRHAAIAAHKRYLLVACKGDVENDGTRGIEGFRYDLVAGAPDLQSGTSFSYSQLVPDTSWLKASLNAAFDTLGNFALTWRSGTQVYCCIFAEKGIRHRRGFWTSPVESLSVTPGDSVRFYPATVTISSLGSWFLEDSIRSGCSPVEFTPSKPWVSLTNSALLSAARANCRYFQFRMTVNRKTIGTGIDSISSPSLSAISFPWNAQPVVVALDSMRVNAANRASAHFDSTVTIFSRCDSMTGFVRLHDADSTGTLTLRTSWPALDAQITLPSQSALDTVIRFDRIVKSDTSVVCTLSLLDTFAWAAAQKTFTIHTRNSLPLLGVRVVSRKTGGGLDTVALTSFRRFGVQEDDSIAFLYTVADTNDSADTRAYIRRTAGGISAVLDSTTSGSEHRFAVNGSALPVADSIIIEFSARDPDTTLVRSASVVVNHLPRITEVRFDSIVVREGDSIRVFIGKPIPLRVTAHDTDLAFWDTLRCGFFTRIIADSLKNRTGDFSFLFTPDRGDTLVTVEVRDIHGKRDSLRFYCEVINHPPRITGVQLDGKTVRRGDSVRVDIGRQIALAITAVDTDLVYLDTMHFLLATRTNALSASSRTGAASFPLTPAYGDTLISIVVRDIYGGADSLSFFLKYPWLALDDVSNPGYRRAIDSLDSAIALIIGSNDTAHIAVPIVNTGKDTMRLTSIAFLGSTGPWLSVGIRQGSGETRFGSQNAASLVPVLMRPDSIVRLIVYATAEAFTGDSVITGRFILGTSDYAHRFDTVPVRMEYNDLPVISSVSPDWDSTRPYTVNGVAKKAAYSSYRFPPHASIKIVFSEPMDSVSATKGITVYSVIDSINVDSVCPIRTRHVWNSRHTELSVSADYVFRSPGFDVLPPRGLFVPTDSLILVATAELQDQATTPHGPNRLDVNGDFARETAGYTLFPMRVDSVTFCVLAVSPVDGDTMVGRNARIELTFSAPVLGSSVDTMLIGNRSLAITSRYNGERRIAYDSITVDGNRVRFYPGITFFYRDSVFCYFRGHSVRNRMGFPSDNSRDGIPVTLFDSLSTAEDVAWRFRVKNIRVVSVTPARGDTVATATLPIVITFSDQVSAGAFDTSLTANRSIQVRSRYAGTVQSSFRSITMSPDHLTVTILPVFGYFSKDSLQCSFFGFSYGYRYDSTVFPGSSVNGFSGLEWYFKTLGNGFYTYPNPYKPGEDPRHCRNSGPCGIWFKNMHTLTTDMTDFRVRIFTIKSFPVYDTKNGGDDLNFSPGEEPQWLWNTRNQRGEFVASGLYFYVVYDALDKALVKGKMLIVR
jgi:hypothetical protein